MRVGMRMRVRVSMAGMERAVFHVHLSYANGAEVITLGAVDAIVAMVFSSLVISGGAI